jgi:hypothetical protein
MCSLENLHHIYSTFKSKCQTLLFESNHVLKFTLDLAHVIKMWYVDRDKEHKNLKYSVHPPPPPLTLNSTRRYDPLYSFRFKFQIQIQIHIQIHIQI